MNSILFLIYPNFVISQLVVYKTEYDIRRQGSAFLTKKSKK